MYVGLVDADLLDNGTRHPNLALMKLSSYFKNKNFEVELILNWREIEDYPQVYISKVFTKTKVPKTVILAAGNTPQIHIGGTGFYFDKAEPLSDEIEHSYPDYHLYDNYVNNKLKQGLKRSKLKDYLDSSIGFTTRGCFRKCEFCVNKRYNKVTRHSSVTEFLNIKRKNIILLDDNIFGYPRWHEIFDELEVTDKPFRFEQGLDIRLLTKEKIKRMLILKHSGSTIFAFDLLKDKNIIEEKLKLWRKFTDKTTKLYILSAFESIDEDDIVSIFERIKILFKYNCLPYIMRFDNWKYSNNRGMYINISQWANQPHILKKMSFLEYCNARGKYSQATIKYLKEFTDKYPDIADKYFNLKWEDR